MFHSSLTLENVQDLERIQKTALRVILGDAYEDYQSALLLCGLGTLHARRESRCLDFALKCVDHPRNARFFPLQHVPPYELMKTEKFVVNFAKGSIYKKSAIPQCQRMLNEHCEKTK